MDNVLKKTIREETEKYNKEKRESSKSEGILPVNTSPTKRKNEIQSSTKQSCIRDSAKPSTKKMKKLQVKFERFDPISKTYKLVRQKDGAGPKFLVVYTEDTILFKDIRANAEKRFFDNENCNYFVEELHECVTSTNDMTGQQLDENEYL